MFVSTATLLFFSYGCKKNVKEIISPKIEIEPSVKKPIHEDVFDKLEHMKAPSREEIENLGEKLAASDGDKLLGDIRFHMNRRQFNAAYKELMKEYDGNFFLICSEDPNKYQLYDIFYIDSIIPSFYHEELYCLTLYGKMKDSNMDTDKIIQINYSYQRVIEMFIRKYGNPHKLVYDNDNSFIKFVVGMIWRFKHRTIMIEGSKPARFLCGHMLSKAIPNNISICEPSIAEKVKKEQMELLDKYLKTINKEVEKTKDKERKRKENQKNL